MHKKMNTFGRKLRTLSGAKDKDRLDDFDIGVLELQYRMLEKATLHLCGLCITDRDVLFDFVEEHEETLLEFCTNARIAFFNYRGDYYFDWVNANSATVEEVRERFNTLAFKIDY
jgi:hypothetical protein